MGKGGNIAKDYCISVLHWETDEKMPYFLYRWVSLLVAEIFYPNAYFPINVAKQKLPVKVYPTNLDATMQNFYNFQQFLRRSDQRSHKDHRKVSSYMALAKRDDDITPRKRRAVNSKPPGEEGELTDDKNKNECDGYDEIGCYVVSRLFLHIIDASGSSCRSTSFNCYTLTGTHLLWLVLGTRIM